MIETVRHLAASLAALPLLSFIGGCSADEHAIPDLSCEIRPVVGKDCTEVPSLVEGRIELHSKGTFNLDARYEACYRQEDADLEGTFLASSHENGVDLELLADRSSGGDPEAAQFSRTVGLINLNSETLEGRFTDTAMLIRGRGQVIGPAPVLEMLCSKI